MSKLDQSFFYNLFHCRLWFAQIALIFLFFIFNVDCAYEPTKVTSPQPSITSTTPKAVCSNQLVSQVQIAGINFTPTTFAALTDHPTLVIPQISLQQVRDLNNQQSVNFGYHIMFNHRHYTR
ncbi:MAG: hypothetical protein JW841_05805 [Deltaproteobacteria bacterium]|nr:hypothetical protein [Deltaproteobacteria bacterium]